MQDTVMNIMFAAIVIVMAVVFGRMILKKRKLLKTAQLQEEELIRLLEEDLPEGYVVLREVKFLTKIGRSMADFVILCPYGIFALEYRQFYVYIRANEESRRWTYAESFRGKPFTSPLYQSKIHLSCIKELIGEKPGLQTYPMVAFPNIDEIELKNPTEEAFVGLVPGVVPWIEQWDEEECLTAEEIKAIAELLTLNSKKVEEAPEPEKTDIIPDEYRAFIPADYREPEEDDDDDDDDEYDEDEELEADEDIEEAEGDAPEPAEGEVVDETLDADAVPSEDAATGAVAEEGEVSAEEAPEK